MVDEPELASRLRDFAAFRAEHLDGDEKGEAQVFLDRLFQAFGHQGVRQAGATLERRVRRGRSGTVAFADLVWKPRVVIEMKRAGARLADAYQQAFEYWLHLVPDRPNYVVLCNFDEFWIYDLNRQLDDPIDTVLLTDLPKRWEALAFLLPEPVAPIFQNDLVAVTREAAATIARVINSIIDRGIDRSIAQRFAMQALMAMFAEDIQLLPTHLFTRAVEDAVEGGSSYDLVFVFAPTDWRPSDALQCFAWDDDFHLGVLQSSLHEAWFRARCSTLKSDLRYTSKTVFNSFPWPERPADDHVEAVASAAGEVSRLRDHYSSLGRSLAQQYATLQEPGTNPLRDAHTLLDQAVMTLYGFDADTSVLAQLLALNLDLAPR